MALLTRGLMGVLVFGKCTLAGEGLMVGLVIGKRGLRSIRGRGRGRHANTTACPAEPQVAWHARTVSAHHVENVDDGGSACHGVSL